MVTLIELVRNETLSVENGRISFVEGFRYTPEKSDTEILSSLVKLDCRGCTLTHLPDGMSSLVTLWCWDCASLTHLPDGMSSLVNLSCDGCTSLTHLPDGMSSLVRLWCDGCTSLTRLPDGMSSLVKLYCGYCASLTLLPDGMSSLVKLGCRGCTHLPKRTLDEWKVLWSNKQKLKQEFCNKQSRLGCGEFNSDVKSVLEVFVVQTSAQ